MNKVFKFAAVSVLALMVANPAAAQSAVTGITGLNERIDDIESDVKTDLARGEDTQRFGPLGVPQGWRGSMALSTSATSGNTDTDELSLGSRLTYGTGKWVHLFGIAAEYGRTSGAVTKEEAFVTYEANRYFTDRFYMFGLGRYQYDGVGGTTHEGFIGFGPGIRVLNSPQTTWRLQAGPGALYTESSLGVDNTEAAGIVSSRFYHALTETLSLTNDTDVIMSQGTTVADNDFGLNVKLSDKLSTRFSYRSEYDDSRPIEFDNTVGISLVLGF